MKVGSLHARRCMISNTKICNFPTNHFDNIRCEQFDFGQKILMLLAKLRSNEITINGKMFDVDALRTYIRDIC